MLNDLHAISLEAGFLETLQLFIIIYAFLIYSCLANKVSQEQPFYLSLKSAASMAALISILLLGRETSWGSAYGMSHYASDIFELVMAVLLICGAAYVSLNWLKKEQNKRDAIIYVFDGKTITCLLIIALCFLLSAVFDNDIILSSYSLLFEELSEATAYVLFCISGYFFNKAHFNRTMS